MAADGPNNCGTAADDATVGTVAWTNPTNAQGAADNSDATCSLSIATSHYLKCTNFGFSMPTGATVDGVTVTFHRKGSSGSPADSTVKLVVGGSFVGNNKSAGATWPGTYEDKSFGGAADLWGATITPSDVNASNFGVGISATTGLIVVANVDSVSITVNYTILGSVAMWQRRSRQLVNVTDGLN